MRMRAGSSTVRTKKNVDSVCELLLQHGILAGRYHAGLSLEERKESQDDFTMTGSV